MNYLVTSIDNPQNFIRFVQDGDEVTFTAVGMTDDQIDFLIGSNCHEGFDAVGYIVTND